MPSMRTCSSTPPSQAIRSAGGVRALFALGPAARPGDVAGIGSVLLIPELLSRPTRDHREAEVAELAALLARLELRPVDEATADLAAALGADYRLQAVDAVHLATGVLAGADRFITNNTKDFTRSITEIDVTFPTDLDDPGPQGRKR